MNAPMSLPAAAPVARRLADPASLAVPTSTGVAGVVVVYGSPATKPTPTSLRDTFADALDRADQGAGDRGFLASLPDVVTPVAVLGSAVRRAVDEGHRWVFVRQAGGSSRWTYASATITTDSVAIVGAGTSAEVAPDGALTVEPGVPPHIEAALREAYTAARGVVEPSKVQALVTAHLHRQGGRQLSPGAMLLPAMSTTTTGVLAGLIDLGGYALAYPVADAAQIATLAAPVVRSIEEQIADVAKAAQDFVEKARKVAAPDSSSKIQARSIETVRAEIQAARKAAALWRDRLSLVSLDVDDALDALKAEADKANAAALAAMDAR